MWFSAKYFLLITVLLPFTEAGFRCFFGNWACTAGCVVLGQSSGLCDSDKICHCSENKININHFRAMLPSRCLLGQSACEGTCHAIGRSTGVCKNNDCACSDTYISPSEFALCAAESTCRMHCQSGGYATGNCDGWACNCVSNRNSGGLESPTE
uniref:Uncharacterized protein n=1 Tax=Pseudodiaptomus poplesia TaxID=213370 RepID=A0A1S6GL85_9MAXI|nr:hypothetical protein [Pseudodiaptomus poplesia]